MDETIDTFEIEALVENAENNIVSKVPTQVGVSSEVVSGDLQYSNGDTYVGTVDTLNGLPSGTGILTISSTNEINEGEFVNGQLHGIGSATKQNGDKFMGRFSQDHFENGVYIYGGNNNNINSKATRYKGSFRENLPNGTGCVEFNNGDIYEGSFDSGKVHGTGRYVTKSGDVIAGIFENGRPTKGMKLSSAGHKYLGEFHPILGGGRFHGLGQLEFANGDCFEGNFLDGCFNGEGTYTFADGMSILCNNWINDEPSGPTEITLPDGTNFSGSFFSDRKRLVEGRGVMKFSDGSWFEARSFRRVGVMPSDADGGAFYFNKKAQAKSWISLESIHATPGKIQTVWLALAGYQSLGLRFSSNSVDDSSISNTKNAHLLLSAHQHIQYALTSSNVPKDDISWMSIAEEEKYPRVEIVKCVVRAVIMEETPRGFCLIGSYGSQLEGNDDTTMIFEARKQAENLNVNNVLLIEIGASSGELIYFKMNNNASRLIEREKIRQVIENDCFKDLSSPNLIILALTTGYLRNDDVQWLVHELLRYQSKLLVAWVGGNYLKPTETSSSCSDVVIELVSKNAN